VHYSIFKCHHLSTHLATNYTT